MILAPLNKTNSDMGHRQARSWTFATPLHRNSAYKTVASDDGRIGSAPVWRFTVFDPYVVDTIK